jgi:hypothetical protein
MRLHGADDFPFHQGLTPLHVPATSDSHYQDGYYFALYATGVHVFAGLRLHPNNNVMDGYAGVVAEGEQRNVRVTRALLPDYDRLEVGPLRLEIVEPMRRQRLTLGDNPTGLAFDVEFTASAAEFVEHIESQHRYGRLYNHVVRYTQPCRATGRVTIDGRDRVVDRWFACRDHSWGIRSTMGPHVPIGGGDSGFTAPDRRAIRIWVPFEVEGCAGFFHTHEDAAGRALDFEGRLEQGGRTVDLAGVRHVLRYHQGTRRLRGGEFTLVDVDGVEREFAFEAACDPAHPQGFGYSRGWMDGGQPGVYRGVAHVEHDRFRVDDPSSPQGPEHVPAGRRLGGTEFACTLTGPGGATGMAHVEHMIYGAYAPYGFTA